MTIVKLLFFYFIFLQRLRQLYLVLSTTEIKLRLQKCHFLVCRVQKVLHQCTSSRLEKPSCEEKILLSSDGETNCEVQGQSALEHKATEVPAMLYICTIIQICHNN